jgi:hypothetical protein
MSKHTPAPWVLKIRPAEHNDNVTVAEIEVNGKYRGGIARLQSAEHIDGIGKDELIANARLIAAAPDMLADLKRDLAFASEVVVWLKVCGHTGFTSAQMRVTALTAAITKATGDL